MALCAGCSRTFPPEHPISSQGVRQSHFPANAPHQADAALVLQHVCAAQDEVGMALADLAAARARAIDWLVHVASGSAEMSAFVGALLEQRLACALGHFETRPPAQAQACVEHPQRMTISLVDSVVERTPYEVSQETPAQATALQAEATLGRSELEVLRDLQTQDQSSDNSDGGVQQVSVLRALLSDDPRATDL
mmetsp:Transcript_118908/g.333008  ORF Transcript_118908/g.333008 Transcript_118908/m.333008 type:complete len:194 (-) Transcript_118908:355-936(-)